MHSRFVLAACAVAALLSSCASFGPRTIPSARFDYNEALARSWNEQLLLNLVRLRYRDTPQFLQIGSVLSRYSLQGGANAEVEAGGSVTDGTVTSTGLNLAYEETPTITYVPLQGEDFTRHLLTPIGPQPLFLLARSGWSIERLLRCGVQQVNGIQNAPSTAGPTPVLAPDTTEFRAICRLLRELQVDGQLAGMLEGPDATSSASAAHLPRLLLHGAGSDARVSELRARLKLVGGCDEFPVVSGLGPGTDCSLTLQTRSLLGVMFFLSLGVEAPESDLAQGRMTNSVRRDGTPYDWREMVGDLLWVRYSEARPEHAYVAVPYRGLWWYIDDADLESKSTFFLLTWLFNLQASTPTAVGPVLTVGSRG